MRQKPGTPKPTADRVVRDSHRLLLPRSNRRKLAYSHWRHCLALAINPAVAVLGLRTDSGVDDLDGVEAYGPPLAARVANR